MLLTKEEFDFLTKTNKQAIKRHREGKTKKGSVSVAEYREGSILARIEELEVATNPEFRFENTREKIEYYKAVGELKAYKELKAMVEARRDELENPNYREGLGAVHERKRDLWKIDELTRLLGDEKEVEKTVAQSSNLGG